MLSKNLHDVKTNSGLVGQPVSNRDAFEGIWPLVLALWEEGAELVSDLAGQRRRLDLNLIAGGAVFGLAGDVLDEDDLDIPLDQLAQEVTDDTLRFVLPNTWITLRNVSQTMNDEVVLIPHVLLKVGYLGVLGELVLEGPVQAAVVLFESHHAVFQNTRTLNALDHDLFWAAGQGLDQSIGTVIQMKYEFQTRVGSQMNTVDLEGWGWKAGKQMDVGHAVRLGAHHA